MPRMQYPEMEDMGGGTRESVDLPEEGGDKALGEGRVISSGAREVLLAVVLHQVVLRRGWVLRWSVRLF